MAESFEIRRGRLGDPEPAEEVRPKAPAAPPAEGTVAHWAAKKGHVPPSQAPGFRGEIHRGPHVDVVRTQGFVLDSPKDARKPFPVPGGWPLNLVVTEEQYDEAVTRAYAPLGKGGVVAVGENLPEQKAAAEAANARAEKKAASKKKAEG